MNIFQADRLAVEAYRMVEAALPEPGAGQVRVKITACGVGYVDALVATGGYQVKPPTPYTPGGEIAGVIDAVGPGVAGFAAGDRVLASTVRGFAEYAIAKAGDVFPLPERLGFEQAACLPLNYLTALHGLKDRAQLQPGALLLVTGAAGGVGLAAVQIGRALGATVIAAASSEAKREFALAHGAYAVIDTAPEGWRDRLKEVCGGKTLDVVFDPVCGPLFQLVFRSLGWQGRHLVVGFIGGPIPALPANLTLMKGSALTGVDVRQFKLFQPELAARHMAQLVAWAGEGVFTPVVGRVFPFAEAADAMQFALAGASLGKTVLKIA